MSTAVELALLIFLLVEIPNSPLFLMSVFQSPDFQLNQSYAEMNHLKQLTINAILLLLSYSVPSGRHVSFPILFDSNCYS